MGRVRKKAIAGFFSAMVVAFVRVSPVHDQNAVKTGHADKKYIIIPFGDE